MAVYITHPFIKLKWKLQSHNKKSLIPTFLQKTYIQGKVFALCIMLLSVQDLDLVKPYTTELRKLMGTYDLANQACRIEIMQSKTHSSYQLEVSNSYPHVPIFKRKFANVFITKHGSQLYPLLLGNLRFTKSKWKSKGKTKWSKK